MNDGKTHPADWLFRALLILLVLVWAAFPPQPSAFKADAARTVAETQGGSGAPAKLVP